MGRPTLSLALLVLSLVAFVVPFSGATGQTGSVPFALAALLRDGVAPRALGLAVLLGLGAWGLARPESGARARGLRVGVRAFLRGAALVNLGILLTLLASSPDDPPAVAWRSVARVEAGGWCALLALAVAACGGEVLRMRRQRRGGIGAVPREGLADYRA